MNWIFRIFFILLILTVTIPAQENYYSANTIYNFAEYLLEEKDFIRAAGEFQRLLVLQDSSLSKDFILFKIGICYKLAGKYKKSNHYLKKVIDNYQSSNFVDSSHIQIVYNYMISGDHEQANNYIHTNMHNISSEKTKYKLNIFQGVNYLYYRKWQKAYDHFYTLHNKKNFTGDKELNTYLLLSEQAIRLKYKSKFFAGFLSAIIPGSGKMYAGNFKDGLYSFILIGLCTWQAYEGFSDNGTHSFKGWAYGSIGTFFYLGNIYGSMVAVKIYNEQIENEFIRKVELNFTLN